MIKNLICQGIQKNTYLYDYDNTLSEITNNTENISIPLVMDTEYEGFRRLGITVQCKGIFQDKGKIFSHPDIEKYAIENNFKLRHTVLKSEFSAIDYLQSMGLDIKLITGGSKKIKDRKSNLKNNILYPFIQFDIYAHFALAELFMIFNGEAKKDILQIVKNKQKNGRCFEMTRRLRTVTYGDNLEVSDSVELPWYVLLNGVIYRVKLRIIDSVALHGIASYKDLNKNVGNVLLFKDLLSQHDKENMIETYFHKPNEFDDYSLGDLEVYNILVKNNDLMLKVYQSLNIENYFSEPKLTIGSTVSNLFEKVLFNHFEIPNDDTKKQNLLIDYCRWIRPENLKTKVDSTECLLAKVIGGRCNNNRIFDVNTIDSLINIIVDADISGAYASTNRSLTYPIGKPVIESYTLENHNKYQTLREWLKNRKYGKKNCELIPNLWQVIVSNKELSGDYETLEYSQDLIPSWFDFKYKDIATMSTDTDDIDNEIELKTGKVKILNNQIINGVITSDILEVIENHCNAKQRNELLDNLYVISSCYYPSYSRLNTLDELIECVETWENQTTTRSRKSHKLKNGVIVKIINEPTYWLGLNIGELLIDKLIVWRQYYKLKDGNKSSLQTLFKLICNTFYGVMCSPYFKTSNSLLGNQITAKCRVMAWCMEKGLNGFQSITDGTQLDPNKVIYSRNNLEILRMNNLVNLHRVNDVTKNNVILKPLNGLDKIENFYDGKVIKLKLYKDDKIKIVDDSNEWFNQKILEHLKLSFPKLSIFSQEFSSLSIDKDKSLNMGYPVMIKTPCKGVYTIEIKDIYDKAFFHGSANYLMINKYKKVLAMRSYENNKYHHTFELKDNKTIHKINFYDELFPSEFFLKQLENPNSVLRSKPFKKTAILKLNEFRNNFEKWHDKGFYCGDTIEKQGLLCEFSLSMFTYQTAKQLIAIEKEYTRNKSKYGQSFEGFFINKDGSLNYLEMLKTIDNLISQGVTSINKTLDKDRNKHRYEYTFHPEKELYDFMKITELLNVNDYETLESIEDEILESLNSEDVIYFDGEI